MLEKVKKWCREQQLFAAGDAVVIACSGGPDSLALTDVLLRLREEWDLQLHVAHLDHMFRGEASRADAVFVQEFCRKNNLPCQVRTVDVPAYARTHGLSDETAAREVRYGFLREVAAGLGGARIATAHHRNDQAETVLLHLFRGAGSRGLAGIRPAAAGIIRPFLAVTRQEIESYCQQRCLQPRFDSTNEQTDYTRNKIRLELMPELQAKYNPAIVEALCRSAALAGDEHDFLQAHVLGLWPTIAAIEPDRVALDRRQLLKQHVAVQREIFRLAVEQLRGDLNGLSFSHMEILRNFAAAGRTGKSVELPGGLSLHCRYDKLELAAMQPELPCSVPADWQVELQVPGRTELKLLGLAVEVAVIDCCEKCPDRRTILCDAARIQGPIFVRRRQDGDRFSPSGLGGRKKLKEFFIDQKIDRDQRDRIPLFCDERGIFWVGGYRQNALSRADETTTSFLRLTIKDLAKEGKI